MNTKVTDLGVKFKRVTTLPESTEIGNEEKYDVVLVSYPFEPRDLTIPFKWDAKNGDYVDAMLKVVDRAKSLVSDSGILLVYGLPRWLPYTAVYLDRTMIFKYWIALKTKNALTDESYLEACHLGVLVFTNHKTKSKINKVRYPHIFCRQCGDFLADWGGKKHLRHPDGPVVSDVWDDRDDFVDEKWKLTEGTISRLMQLTAQPDGSVLYIDLDRGNDSNHSFSPSLLPSQNPRIALNGNMKLTNNVTKVRNRLFLGSCTKIMADWVARGDVQFDLIFADPPYNLQKNYGKIDDKLRDQEYLEWCNEWLGLCTELLSPEGTLYVLNLPKWCYQHAVFLNDKLFFQRWIVWDALSDPRGNMMPAHYGLLVYTKNETKFTFHKPEPVPQMNLCLRPKCIKSRIPNLHAEVVSDLWYDVHRIKHKRDRDAHPCQLPPKLLERVIQMSSNQGDLVFDPFLGTGTTVSVAKRLGRAYTGIDIDEDYLSISESRLERISTLSDRQQLVLPLENL
jgi:DNA modification methylase